MDCRPICKGEAIKKVITKALYKLYMNKIKAGCEPSQLAVGTNGGGSELIMAITLLLDANPDWVIIALDISNSFNEIQRYSVLEDLRKSIELRPLLYYNFRNMMISGFIGLGYGPFMKAATYQMNEGVKQGMEAMSNFFTGINQTNKSTHDSLQEKGGVLLRGADNTYILGPPQIAFPEVKLHEERLTSIGLKLNYSKMKCYTKESKKSVIYHELRKAANIPEGFIEGEDGTRLFGLRAYGVPIGSEIFVTEWLKTKGKRITSKSLEIGNLLDPTRSASRDIPSRQCLWLLILNCLQFIGNYILSGIYHLNLQKNSALHLTQRSTNSWLNASV